MSSKWVRVGYPAEGEPVEHGHGNDNTLPHTHVGGDFPHGHRHRKTGPDEYEDTFYLHAVPPECSCPRTAPIKGPKGWCNDPLLPHEWTDARTNELFWCPGYWHE